MPDKHRCKVCGKTFRNAGALRQHMKNKHPGRHYSVMWGIPAAVIVIIAVASFLLAPQLIAPSTTQTTQATHLTTTQPSQKTTTAPSSPKAPDFNLPVVDRFGLTGEMKKLSDFKGKPVFLEFFSPYCPHCFNMIPTIDALREKYGGRMVFLTISAPYLDQLLKVMEKHESEWNVLLDEEFKVFKLYGVQGTPTYFILDSEHRIVKKLVGKTPEKELERALEVVLQE